MHRLPAPTLHLFRRGARVFVPPLVVPEDPPVGISHPDELRNSIGQPAKLFFTTPQGFFCSLAFGDIASDRQLNRLAVLLPKRSGMSLHMPANTFQTDNIELKRALFAP